MKKVVILLLVLVPAAIFFLLVPGSFRRSPDGNIAPAALPERIVSLGPSVTKGLYLLGAGERLLANTVYCTEPPDAAVKEKIGTLLEVNVEKIFALRPDLVLATALTPPGITEKLRGLGIRVFIFGTPATFEDICGQFLTLGRLTGLEKEAAAMVLEARTRVLLIREKVKGRAAPKVMVQVGARPLFVATGSYFVNDYIRQAGGRNIAEKEKDGIYSREKVIEQNPDVIIIASMGLSGEEEKKMWLKYQTVGAVKNSRIYIVDGDKIASPTPPGFAGALAEFVRILYQEK